MIRPVVITLVVLSSPLNAGTPAESLTKKPDSWFHSDEGNWTGFKSRYRKELSALRPEAEALRKAIGRRKATFLYATKAEAHNHAQLLEAYLARPK